MGQEGILLGVELVAGAGIKKDVGYVVCRGVWHDVWGWVGYQGAVRGKLVVGVVSVDFSAW